MAPARPLDRRAIWLAACTAVGLAVLAGCASPSPQDVVAGYARAVYARDYAAAYAYLAAEEQAALSQAAYVAQSDAFEGGQLEVARHLAGLMAFDDVRVTQAGDLASVTVHVRVPDGNAPAVAEILALASAGDADADALKAKVDDLLRTGRLPFLEGDQTFELRRAGGRWGIDLHLRQAARVTFSAGVQAGLPWEFTPLQTSARLLPGELVRVQFRVKNLSDQAVVGKADEDTLPSALADHVYFYQCFCMWRLTLAPGEEQTLTVVLSLVEPLPAGQNELQVHYDFYPLEAFPDSDDMHADGESHGAVRTGQTR